MKRINILNYITLLLLFSVVHRVTAKELWTIWETIHFLYGSPLWRRQSIIPYKPSMHAWWWNEYL